MADWKVMLADVDDDYLMGIANKGIVKRAYKDKEAGNYQVLSLGEEAEVSAGGEKVLIRIPLGESKCSCPSRSICRHVILGILALKEKAGELPQEEAQTQSQDEGQPQEEASAGEKNYLESKLMEEIAAYPDTSLRRILGGRQLQGILEQRKAGRMPPISYASVITVELTGMNQTVKLLSPLAHSSCTCHKKDFCVHKAAALLWCRLDKGLVEETELEEKAAEPSYDRGQIKEAALQMKAFLEELLQVGLARLSSDVSDRMERFATISHNLRLAEFEGYFRALRDSYENYFGRKASFRIQNLMEQFSRLYRRVELLLAAKSDGEISELAGEFRAEYLPAGNLNLLGIAIEHFESKTGYEGETVYFLEENSKEWYTYTWARPIFYEDAKGRRRQEKAKAPWGLPLSLEGLSCARIQLTGARCDFRRRLSASQETRGELLESRGKEAGLSVKDLGGWYYRDFGKLFTEQIDSKRISWLKKQENEKEDVGLVFVRPASCQKAVFSETEQTLFMSLYDEKGKEILIETVYSKKEAWGIRYLERIKSESHPCFLGKIYLKDGKVRMYPVAVFEKGELQEDGEDK